MMSMEGVFAESESQYKAAVLRSTWGHLEGKPGTAHHGEFIFVYGQHGDQVVVASNFPSIGEGPQYFTTRGDFIDSVINKYGFGEGIYKFIGMYRVYKNGSDKFFGKVYRLRVSVAEEIKIRKRKRH